MSGVAGTVKVNDKDRNKYRREVSSLSCYIMQDDALRPALTVKEAMTFAAHLKLGYSTSHGQKQRQVREHRTAGGNEKEEYDKYDRSSGTLSIGCKHAVRKLFPLSSEPVT